MSHIGRGKRAKELAGVEKDSGLSVKGNIVVKRNGITGKNERVSG